VTRPHPHRTAVIAALLLLTSGRLARSEITHVGTALRVAAGGTADAANTNDIAFDDKHNVYLVVWSTASFSSPQGHTYGAFIRPDGTKISTFLISQGELAYATVPRVAYSSGTADDVFLVVYGSDANMLDKTNLFGQLLRYNPTTGDPDFIGPGGSPTPTNFPVSRNSGDPQFVQWAGGIAYNPVSRNFLVTWHCVAPGGDMDTWARLINPDGTPINNDKNLSASPWSQGGPDVAFDPVTNRYLVVYTGDTADGITTGTFAALVDGQTGDPIGNSMTQISSGTAETEGFVLYLPEPRMFLAGWTEITASGRDIMGRKVDGNGVTNGAVYPLVQTFANGTYPLNEGKGAAVYNPNSHSVLLACMHDSGYIWGAELDGSGATLQTLQLSTNPGNVAAGGGSFTPRVAWQTNEFGVSYALDYKEMWFERFQAGPPGPTLTADPPSPVGAGTPVTFTATTSLTPAEYRFTRYDGTSWTTVQDYGSSTSYVWASPTIGTYSMQVWIRTAGSTVVWPPEQWAAASMVVTPPPVTSVAVTPSATTVLPGRPITWTASAAGGGGCAVIYQFFLKNLTADTPFTVVQAYSTTTTWTFSTPTVGTYLMQVWAKCEGSSASYEAWGNSALVDVGVVSVTVTPSTTTATTGSSVTWTATAIGGVAPVQYRFCMINRDGGPWTEVQAYGPSPTFTLPQAANGHWVVEVWARSTGSTLPHESYGDAATVTVAPAPIVVTSVTANFTAASDGTPITWTATATGGTAPLQYRFYRREPSGLWTIVQDYSASNRYTWSSATVGSYQVEAWVRSYGSSAAYETYGDSPNIEITSVAAVTAVSVAPSATQVLPRGSVTWSATATGGVQPVQYRFCITNLDVGGWTEVAPWSTTSTWTMTNATAGHYLLQVWARSHGSTRVYDAYADAAIVTVGIPPVAVTSLVPSATSAMGGDSVTWTAVATGGTPPLQYRFYRYDSTTGWTMVRDYGTSSTYTWPSVTVGTFTVEVWVKSAGSTRQFEAYADSVPVVVIPRPPVAGVTVAVTATAVPFGSPVTWTASASGGVTPYQYRFFLRNGATGVWTSVQGYGTSPSWSSSTLAPGDYLMQVWARSAGSTAAWEAWNNAETVTILQPPPPVIGSFTASPTPVTAGTPVTLTATTSGGVGPVVYTFWIRDDSTMTWTQIQKGTSNTCSVTPPHAGSYLTEVWVSSAGATAAYQAFADLFVVAQ